MTRFIANRQITQSGINPRPEKARFPTVRAVRSANTDSQHGTPTDSTTISPKTTRICHYRGAQRRHQLTLPRAPSAPDSDVNDFSTTPTQHPICSRHHLRSKIAYCHSTTQTSPINLTRSHTARSHTKTPVLKRVTPRQAGIDHRRTQRYSRGSQGTTASIVVV